MKIVIIYWLIKKNNISDVLESVYGKQNFLFQLFFYKQQINSITIKDLHKFYKEHVTGKYNITSFYRISFGFINGLVVAYMDYALINGSSNPCSKPEFSVKKNTAMKP